MERWKPIADFKVYEVSDLGRVRRVVNGRTWNARAGTILKQNVLKKGYLAVRLYNESGKRDWLVHVLVALAFIPNPKGLPQVNHLGQNGDNRASQLEWRSEAGNMLHAVKTGRKAGDGVSFNKKTKKWRAGFCPEPNVRIYLGEYKTRAEAVAIRKKAVDGIPNVE